MKRVSLLAALICLMCTKYALAQTITLTAPPNGNNQKSSVTQWIGLASVTITYRGPDVHGPRGEDRKGHIWGELVHYGLKDPDGFGTSLASPWRAGANEITSITFSHDVKINGKDLKAGTYGLMMQLEKDKPWTWIFNKNSTSWGVYYYSPDEDVLRVETTPEDAPYMEWLTYGFDDRQAESAVAYLRWENKRVPFKIEVPNAKKLYVDQIRSELVGYAGFNSNNWLSGARYCLNNKVNLEEALKWVENTMSERFNNQKNFTSMQLKSQILNAMNRTSEADAIMKEAIDNLNPTMQEIHQYGRYLLTAGKNQEALEIYKLNRQRYKEDTFTTYVGLARGYAAVGNKKEAIKNWEIALKNIPENQLANKSAYQDELEKLKK
jgi:tetratricopeptide (TPR) repeat protein